MTRKTWSTADVSAYLDGELTPEVQVAFEAAVKQDPDLHRRVTEIQQVVTLMRSAPLQEPPRNYLLTQAMVNESKPQARRRGIPLLMMRIATSVAAAAFVIASGLTFVQQGITPGMVTQSRAVPEAAVMLEREAANDTVEMLEAPMMQAVPAEELTDSEIPAVPDSEKAMTFAEAVDEGMAPETSAELALDEPVTKMGEEFGMGGGGEVQAPEADADWAEAPVETTETGMGAEISAAEIPDARPEEDLQAETELAPPDMIAATEAMTAEDARAGEEPREDDSVPTTRAVTQEKQMPEMVRETIGTTETPTQSTRTAAGPWGPIGLGILTAVLAGITFWVSRRQRH